MSSERIGVVGAGIIGLAVARRMTQLRPEAVVTVLEKEDAIATHQTGRNSGVVHAGIYYAPGSLKAELCRRGVGLLRGYCEERGIRFVECGKVVVSGRSSSPLDTPRSFGAGATGSSRWPRHTCRCGGSGPAPRQPSRRPSDASQPCANAVRPRRPSRCGSRSPPQARTYRCPLRIAGDTRRPRSPREAPIPARG